MKQGKLPIQLSRLLAGSTALLLALSLTGCNGREAPGTSALPTGNTGQSQPPVEADPSQPPVETAQGNQIRPILSGVSIDALDNCTVAVSFENADVAMEDGALTIHMTVYDRELFDMADIAGLREGDTLVIAGREVSVRSVERGENGVMINGGAGAGGVRLVPEEGGTFSETTSDTGIVPRYLPLGEITLPVDQEMMYFDNNAPEPFAYYAGDLLTLADTVDFSCTAQDCSVVIANGRIMSVTRGIAAEGGG